MARYRTALGRTLDMSALAAKNERVRAVGNMSVNARGDTIDNLGRIVVPVTQKTGESYQKTVKNKSAQEIKKPNINVKPQKPKQPQVVVKEELTNEELELEESLEDDLEIEKIKQKELKK